VRFINATADLPTLTVFMDFVTVAAGLGIGQSTEPTTLDAGSYTLRLMPDGARPGDSSLFETPLELTSAQVVTLIITNQGDSYQLLPITDSVPPLNAGESAFTLINTIDGSADAGLTTGTGGDYTGLTFGERRTISPIPSGATNFTIQVEGAARGSYQLELAERTHYTLVIGGSSSQPQVVAYGLQAPGRTSLNILNVAPSLNAIDVYLNDDIIQQTVEFSRLSAVREVPAETNQLTIYEAGADRSVIQPLLTQTILLPADSVTLAIMGESGSYQAIAFPIDRSPTPIGQARVSFLNTLPGIPAMVVETSGGPLRGLDQIIYGQPPAATLVNAASISFTILGASTVSGQATTVEAPQNLQFEAGFSYLYIITGRQDTPLILSENVSSDSDLPTNQEVIVGTAQPARATFHFINAVASQEPMDFWLGGNRAANAIAFGQSSALVPLNDLTVPAGVSPVGAAGPLMQEYETLQDGETYTAIAFGVNQATMRLFIVADEPQASSRATALVRLINLSDNPDVRLSLGFSIPDPTPVGPTPPPPTTEELDLITTRFSLPLGVTALIPPVGGMNSSQTVRVPIGIYKMYIIDAAVNLQASTVPVVELASGTLINIITFQQFSSDRVVAFAVTIPSE
jgi:hypothetical protein